MFGGLRSRQAADGHHNVTTRVGVAVASGRPGAYPCGHSPVVLLKNYAIRTKYADAKAVAISALTNTWDERNFVASSPASMKALLAGPHIFSVVQRADHT